MQYTFGGYHPKTGQDDFFHILQHVFLHLVCYKLSMLLHVKTCKTCGCL